MYLFNSEKPHQGWVNKIFWKYVCTIQNDQTNVWKISEDVIRYEAHTSFLRPFKFRFSNSFIDFYSCSDVRNSEASSYDILASLMAVGLKL